MSLDVNISEPEEFNCVELHACLKDVAEILAITDFEYCVEHISGGRDNFIANIFRVVIKDVDRNVSHNVIVKTLINTTRRELFHDIHKREVIVYNKVLPKFKEVQKKFDGVNILFPECLYANAERGKEVIIFRDLNEIGFVIDETLARYEDLTYDKVKLILTELAKFHALSFAFENENYEEFSDVKHKFNDIIFQDKFLSKTKLRNYFFESFDMAVALVTDDEAKKKLLKIRPKLLELLKIYNEPSKYSVLCHGDLWMNNMLFKENSDNSKICFLDFQALRYTSPVNDIIYFLYICTTSQFRSDHFQDLQSVYYDSLNSILKLYDIDVNLVYPRDEYVKDLKDKMPLGLLIALVELRIITMTPEDEAILKGSKLIPGWDLTQVPGEIELYKYRVNDVIQECMMNGVIDQLLEKINL